MAKTERNCAYSDGVICATLSSCDKCGWNPRVHEARVKELRDTGKISAKRWERFCVEEKL